MGYRNEAALKLRRTLIGVTATAIYLASAQPVRAEIEAILTAVEGHAQLEDRAIMLHGRVLTDENLATGPDSSCSVLVDRETVVQFCGRTSMQFREDSARKTTIVQIDEGSARTIVQPRSADEPLEIHTPIAVAVIVGTVLTTTVDPVTGDTTFAVESGTIRVRSSDPAVTETITVSEGERVTVRRGQPPGRIEPLHSDDLVSRSCVSELRMASLRGARESLESEVTDDITKQDIPGLTEVSGPPPRIPPHEPPLPSSPCEVYPLLCNPPTLLLPAPPEPCAPGGAGDHCRF
jgi:hypothetical protein